MSIPKDRDPRSLTLEECQAIIAAAPTRTGRWARKAAPAKTTDKPDAAAGTPAAAPKKKAVKKKKAAAKKKS